MTQNNNLLAEEYKALWEEYDIETPTILLKNRLPASAKILTSESKKMRSLGEIQTWIGNCQRCQLCHQRNQIVFGSGNPKSPLMFVGEGPGSEEDRSGIPFIGPAGELLTKIIEAMGRKRDEVYLTNIVKCRPPDHRAPTAEESAECLPFLKAQIQQIQPKLIVALGLTATVQLTGQESSLSALRGRFQSLSWDSSVNVMPTYHPAYLLRNPAAKKLVWDDMKLVMKRLGGSPQ
jgi:uracil-DNA glycosylase